MQVQRISSNLIRYNSKMQLEDKEVLCQDANTTTMPSFADAKNFVNVNFKAIDKNKYNQQGNTELIQAIYDNNKAEFEMLMEDPNTDVNERDQYGFTPLMRASHNGKFKYFFERLLQHPKIDVNATIKDDIVFMDTCVLVLLATACGFDKMAFFEKILEHPDVDVDLYFNYEKKHTLVRIGNYEKYEEMMRNYKRGVDRREKTNQIVPGKIDINKIISFNEIWTDPEKQTIEKLISTNSYRALINLIELKFNTLNEEFRNMSSFDEIKKSVRETETETIRKEEKEKAEKALAEREQKLVLSEEKIKNKEKALDNLISNYQQILAEDVANERKNFASGIRTLYGIQTEELPKDMSMGEQMVYVMNILLPRKKKLKNFDGETPERITKELRDNDKNLSSEGLKFLERIFDVSEQNCGEKEIIDAIRSVKNDKGLIDMGKAAFFISSLAWGGTTIQNVIQKTAKLAIK